MNSAMLTRGEISRGLLHCIDANQRRGITLREQNVEVQVHIEEGRALVVVAGSNGGKDWFRNLQIARVRVMGLGGVHLGRWRDWQAIERPLRRYLDTHAKDHVIDLRGHSQGGGVIQVAACRLGRPVRSVVTYGAHRVFDQDAAGIYAEQDVITRRVVVGWDCVPRWPKNMMGYVHAGPMLCLSRKGAQLREQEKPRLTRPWEFITRALDNHISDDEYYRAVRDWAKPDPEAAA